jgi:unconventional SNARE in the endoplasmic reticulum protein 1
MLQEQLADLESYGDKVGRDAMQQYRQHVEVVVSQLKKATPAPYAALVAAVAATSRQDEDYVASAPALPRHAVTPPAQTAPPERRDSPAAAAAATTTSKAAPSTTPQAPKISEATKTRLATQSRLQEDLTDELVGLAAALKTNTLAMEDKVRHRGTLLESAEGALDKSAAATKRSAARATAIYKKGRLNLCFKCLVMMILGCGFAAMFFFIRITTFTGYSREKARAASLAASGATVPPPAPVVAPSTSQPTDEDVEL